jgi:hypothetical protein
MTLYSASDCKTAADLIKYILMTLYNASMTGILLAI